MTRTARRAPTRSTPARRTCCRARVTSTPTRATARGRPSRRGRATAACRSRRDSEHELPDRARVPVREPRVRAVEELKGVRDPELVQLTPEGLRPEVQVVLVALARVEVDAAQRAQGVGMGG